MCLLVGRKVPIHYISAASVLQYSGLDEFGEESAAGHPPPPDAFDGYSASKWASEVYLGKVYEAQCSRSRWPICIHRPTSVVRDENDDGDGGELIPNFLKYCQLLNAVQLIPNIRGFINLVPLGRVGESLSREMSANVPQQPPLRFLHERGGVEIPLSGLKACIDARTGSSAAQLPPDEFARKAAQAGMDEALVATFERSCSMPPFTWPRLLRNENGPWEDAE